MRRRRFLQLALPAGAMLTLPPQAWAAPRTASPVSLQALARPDLLRLFDGPEQARALGAAYLRAVPSVPADAGSRYGAASKPKAP